MRSPTLVSLAFGLAGLAPRLDAQSCPLVCDINPTSSSSPSNLASVWGVTLYLRAYEGGNGLEPWIHDVATGKCSLLKDIRAGRRGSAPSGFTACWTGTEALVFFAADDGARGRELWVSDGTPAGTRMLKDIYPGLLDSSPRDLVCCNGKVFFSAHDGSHGRELWVSDGTPAGTRMPKDIFRGQWSSSPRDLVCCNGEVFFSAHDGPHGFELWISDGTPAGTRMLKDIYPGSPSSGPSDFVCCNGTLYFTAGDHTSGRELWASDGTPAGTRMLKDLRPGLAGSSPHDLVCCDGKIFFIADDSVHGDELWVSDGTPAGTTMVKDVHRGLPSSGPDHLVCCNGKVFFTADDGARGHELWVSDGTPAGTKMVKDIRPGSGSSSPLHLTCAGDRVYFTAFVSGSGGGHGRELWVSDGTPAGTKEVCDLYSGGNSSAPSDLTVCGGKLFFSAYEPVKGRELYVVERPGAAVERLAEGCPPSYPTLDSTPPRLGGAAVLTSRRGPAAHVGFLVLGLPARQPSPMPFSAPCALWLDLVNGPVVPIGAPSTTPAFTRTLPIPNDPGLEGGKVMLQTQWLNLQTLFPIKGSNGARLTIGK